MNPEKVVHLTKNQLELQETNSDLYVKTLHACIETCRIMIEANRLKFVEDGYGFDFISENDLTHLVIPDVVYNYYKKDLDALGFSRVYDILDKQEIADLHEAIRKGGNINSKW